MTPRRAMPQNQPASQKTAEKQTNLPAVHRHGVYSNQGFTLVELMVAAAIGMVTILVAGRVMVDQLQATRKIETIERQRSDWIRVNRFITNEINLAAEIDDTLDIGEAPTCAIGNGRTKMVVRFPRQLQLHPAVYYTTTSQAGWVDNVLKRCGPSLAESGDYDANTLSDAVILDALSQKPQDGDGFVVTLDGDRMANFSIKLTGKLNNAYKQQEGARARVRDVFLRPSELSLCLYDHRADQNGVKKTLTQGDDTFLPGDYADWENITDGNVLICGNGGKDVIQGGYGDDIVEASNPGRSQLMGGPGNDRLLGSDNNDQLIGDEGDDILISKRGDDVMQGGGGTNHYVPGLDDDKSRCDRDIVYGNADDQNYDVIYLNKNFDQYQLSDPCTTETCRVQRKDAGTKKVVDIYGGELLVFEDQQTQLSSGTPSELPALDPAPCNPPDLVGGGGGGGGGGDIDGGGDGGNIDGGIDEGGNIDGGVNVDGGGDLNGGIDGGGGLDGGGINVDGGDINPGDIDLNGGGNGGGNGVRGGGVRGGGPVR